jgi:hypothetical protein
VVSIQQIGKKKRGKPILLTFFKVSRPDKAILITYIVALQVSKGQFASLHGRFEG